MPEKSGPALYRALLESTVDFVARANEVPHVLPEKLLDIPGIAPALSGRRPPALSTIQIGPAGLLPSRMVPPRAGPFPRPDHHDGSLERGDDAIPAPPELVHSRERDSLPCNRLRAPCGFACTSGGCSPRGTTRAQGGANLFPWGNTLAGWQAVGSSARAERALLSTIASSCKPDARCAAASGANTSERHPQLQQDDHEDPPVELAAATTGARRAGPVRRPRVAGDAFRACAQCATRDGRVTGRDTAYRGTDATRRASV